MFTTAEAIKTELTEFAKRESKAIFMAEGINEPTGFFGTLAGLADVVAPNRLIELPISENSMVGVAVGLAQQGYRVVMSFQRVEFVLLALEQIFNNAAKSAFLTEGSIKLPLVIRLVVGRGWGQGPTHSQSLESMFSMIPGLKVLMPSIPNYARDIVRVALEDDNPVVLIEHRWCHYLESSVGSNYDFRPWRAVVATEGTHLSLAATGYAVAEGIALANIFANYGYSIEVIDLSCTRPLDVETVVKSVHKTGHLVTVDTGHLILGIGAELVSSVVRECWSSLRSPPSRAGLPEFPVPSSRFLVEKTGYYPNILSVGLLILEKLQPAVELKEKIINELTALKSKAAIDQPNQLFRGPF